MFRSSAFALSAVLLTVAALAGCAPADPERPARVLELSGDATNGAAVYSRACASCHDADGNGTSTTMAQHVSGSTDEDLAEVIAGGGHVSQSAMSEQEAADLLAYLNATWGS